MSGGTFTEDWFSPLGQERLAELGRQVADVPGMIIEIGCWEGRSTCALANAINPRILHAVDTWQGSAGEISYELAQQRDVFATWQHNIAALTNGNVIAHRMGWREFVPTITDPVALCFIDAEHTYREVYDNITAILPHMSPGGVICGDDVHHPPIVNAIRDTLGLVHVQSVGPVWSWTY